MQPFGHDLSRPAGEGSLAGGGGEGHRGEGPSVPSMVGAPSAATEAPAPAEAAAMDPQQRLVMEHGYSALHSAGMNKLHLEGSATGVFIGIQALEFPELLAGTTTGGLSGLSGLMFSLVNREEVPGSRGRGSSPRWLPGWEGGRESCAVQ